MPQTPCPYCGHTPTTPDADRCGVCNGLFESLSRKATQLAMGPWFIRDKARPFMPGFNEAILRHQVASGRVTPDTVLRGPTTHQFWVRADQAPGVSRLLGKCHQCGGRVSPETTKCGACHTSLALPTDVDRLGLAYTDPAARKHAQAEIDAQRAGKPAPPPPDKPVSVRVSPEPARVHDDLLQPAEPGPTEDAGGFDPDAHQPDPADDLGQAASLQSPRRRKRGSGPNPLALGLGVLLLCSVGFGAVYVLIGMGGEQDDENPTLAEVQDNAPQPIERTAADVEAISGPVLSRYDLLRSDGVPEPFENALNAITRLVEQADRDAKREQYNPAYDKYAQAKAELGTMTSQILAWEQDRQARAELDDLRGRAERLRDQATSAGAGQWAAAALSAGEAAWGRAQPLIEAGRFADAVAALNEAEAKFQEAFDTARSAAEATALMNELDAAVQASHPEQTLRANAAELLERLLAKHREGERRLSARDYEQARRSFEDALAALRQAEQAVELARYRKVYAFDAGYQAAGLLVAIASGDGIDADQHDALVSAFEKLTLPENPAAALSPGTEADYADAAGRLLDAARNALTDTHGQPVQASYHAGVQARIIEQTLASLALTDGQQKRIHQTLNVFQDQAASAGWDISKMSKAVEAVRAANRRARLGEAPEETRAAWAVLIAPLQTEKTAARLMDPVTSPSRPDDPELFPGIGSSGP